MLLPIGNAEALENMLREAKAVVCVFVEWSTEAVVARHKFVRLTERLLTDYPHSQITFYTMEEDVEFIGRWLSRANLEGLPGKYTMGWGSILWFQTGTLVHKVLRACKVSEEDLVAATVDAFGLLANDKA